MIYEPRHLRRFNFVMAGLCAAMSLIGFAAAGIIPTASTRDHGAYPLAGAAIILVCLAAATLFLRRALDQRPRMRMDGQGIFLPRFAPQAIPWDQVEGFRIGAYRNQRYIRFALKDPDRVIGPRGGFKRATTAGAYGQIGINPSYWTPGMNALLATLRHYRPDLFQG